MSYTMTRARYAKRSVAIRALDGVGGMKGRAARLCCALRFRFSNRENAYIGSEAKGRRFADLYAAGWDATFITDQLVPPRCAKLDAQYPHQRGPRCGAAAGAPCRNPVQHDARRGPEDRRAQPVRVHSERRVVWQAARRDVSR